MIPALWLDYQRPAPGRRRPGMVLLGIGLLASGLLFGYYLDLSADVDTAQQEVSRLQRIAARQQPAAADATAAPGTASGGDGPVAHSLAQWEALFASLEAASDDSVTLLALQPGNSQIVITGEAKDLAASMDYMKRLQPSPVLGGVHLTNSELVLGHPQRPLKFSLAAVWREIAP